VKAFIGIGASVFKMTSREAVPQNFETMIDSLVATGDELADVPERNPITIDSLEAAWRLNSRGQRHQAPPTRSVSNPYLQDEINGAASDQLLEPDTIRAELGLNANPSEADVAMLRREFALRNHPDRVSSELRAIATQRMMIANDLTDRYIAHLHLKRT
jgi:hypothetical protein